MAKDPSMPFYVNDWLSSSAVACMTLEQQGAYVRLLCYCWASQTASLPDDDNVLAKLSGMNEGWFNGGSCLVRKCFTKHPSICGAITNDRLHSLWKERETWRQKSVEAGKKSGESRRKSSRSKTKEQTNQPSILVQTKCEPNTNSSSSSSSSSSIENTNTHPHPPNGFDSIETIQNESEIAHAVAMEIEHHDLTRSECTITSTSSDSLNIQLPSTLDTPPLRTAIVDWSKHYFARTGMRFTQTQADAFLMEARRMNWGVDKILESISFSIAKSAKSWCDPTKPFSRPSTEGNGYGTQRPGPGQRYDATAELTPGFGKM